ncbi:S41 family peptidase [Olivibacter sp. SDN3]|uniref:S41 family peptidase n=1 Tax=Olivibacter sp. SDN3 TaxID=2764720 RepID=UPI0016514425|nr:S41 family peptidase [Olivibacter sp. SDN3]QNL48119.1 S41 family peptidase [Olivibacter sp. SDN3]
MKKHYLIVILNSLFMIAGSRTVAQEQVTQIDVARLIDSISLTLKNHYVFPEKAATIEQHLKKRFRTKAYEGIADPKMLLTALNNDIRQVHIDGHMGMDYDPHFASLKQGELKPTKDEIAQYELYEKGQNYQFKKVEILTGNIGYLLLNGFTGDVEGAKSIVLSALQFLANTRAIIIDLRWNGGGDPEMVSYLEGFFFKEKKLINTIIDQSGNDTTYYYADPAKTNGLALDMPVYILTSTLTFSGAEDFSYGMQNVNRAIVVGETTGGGAHPKKIFLIGQGVRMSIPYARSWNPHTKTNWEATGVKPDVPVTADQALPVAQKAILEGLAKETEDEGEKRHLNWALNKLIAEEKPPVPDSLDKLFPSTYTGGLSFYKEGGKLWCKNDELGGNLFQLTFIKDHLFVLDKNAQVQFDVDETGKPSRIFLLFQNGRIVEKPLID